MNFPLYIARRYLFSKSQRNAINIISFISGLAVFVGAFALMIVLSGFSGLREFGLSFSNQFDPDLKVLPANGKVLGFSAEEKEQISKIKGIDAFSEVIEERVLLNFKSKNMPAHIKGVDQNYTQVTEMDSSIILGSWLTDLNHQVVIGANISRQLSLGVNDYSDALQLLVPKPGKGQIMSLAGAFNTSNSFVAGIYSINEELDGKYVFSHLEFARELLNMEALEVSSIEIKLKKNVETEKVEEKIRSILNAPVIVQNRMQQNEALYKMYNTENLAVYLICTLVLIIALFNMIGAIIMVILDKRENIKTLHNLGASAKQIKRIFFLQGILMTSVGAFFGISMAIAVVILQINYDLVMITPTLPYPMALTLKNMLIVLSTIMALGVGTSYIASSRVRKALDD